MQDTTILNELQNMSHEEMMALANNSGEQTPQAEAPTSMEGDLSQPVVETSAAVDANAVAQQKEKDWLEELRRRVGMDISDEETAYNNIIEFKKKASEYESLPDQAKKFIDLIRSGEDPQDFYRLMGTDFATMPDKEVAFELFKRDNKDLYKKNAELAKLKFDVDWADRSNKIKRMKFDNEQDRMEAISNYGQEQFASLEQLAKLEEMEMAQKIADARSTFSAEQSSYRATPRQEMTEQDYRAAYTQYLEEIDRAMNSFSGLSLKISETIPSVKFGMDESLKKDIRGYLGDTNSFLTDIGFNQDGTINYEKLVLAAAKLKRFESMPSLGAAHLGSHRDLNTVEAMLVNPPSANATGQPAKPKTVSELDGKLRAAEKFASKNRFM